jgi:phage terminase large subunit-like protein
VDPIRWDAQSTDESLAKGERITLGFDGSKVRDATSLVACRMSDGKIFHLRTWERPANTAVWQVPSEEVDQVVKDLFVAYDVVLMFADPYRWQDYLDRWSGQWPKQVVEFPTNIEQRMDRAIERFTTAFALGQVANDGDEVIARHCKNAVVVKGSRKKPRPGEEGVEFGDIAQYYLKLAKRGDGQLIDGAVAVVLAYAARGQAIEDGALIPEPVQPFFAAWR